MMYQPCSLSVVFTHFLLADQISCRSYVGSVLSYTVPCSLCYSQSRDLKWVRVLANIWISVLCEVIPGNNCIFGGQAADCFTFCYSALTRPQGLNSYQRLQFLAFSPRRNYLSIIITDMNVLHFGSTARIKKAFEKNATGGSRIKKEKMISGSLRENLWQPLISPEARKERSCQSFSASHIGPRTDCPFHRPAFFPPCLNILNLVTRVTFIPRMNLSCVDVYLQSWRQFPVSSCAF